MARDLYKKTSGNLNFYGSSTFGTEPDMRQEMINTLDGFFPEISKSQPGLLRRARLDSNGNIIACPCVDSFTKEPDKDRFCPICFGEGYMWDEEDVDFYRVLEDSDVDNTLRDKLKEVGLINVPLVVFYMRYSAAITRKDKIVELILEDDGTARIPKKRKEVYKIELVWDYRSDNGKLEYYKIFCHREDLKYLNAPVFGDL